METFLIILAVWVGVYWLPNLAMIIYIERKNQDISLEDLITMSIATAILGPIITIRIFYEHLSKTDILTTVVFRKCTKKEVWKALGGNERNGP